MAEKPLIYLILGAPDSGRRELTFDLIKEGLEKESRPLVLISDKESGDTGIPEMENLTVGSWTWDSGPMNIEIPEEFSHIFLITDARSNPVDQVEAFSEWLPAQELDLARIITIVHARLVFENKELLRWHEACIHFSDVVLINRREELPPKWITEFIHYFKKEHLYPCHFEQVKNGRVKNPALILEPEPRRISLLFDELPMLEEHEMGDDEFEEEDEDLEGDPYLHRLASGRREKQIPDIRKYLD